MHRQHDNPHDRLMERAWQNARRGLAICRADQNDMDTVVAWATTAKRHMWVRLLAGDLQPRLSEIEQYESFFDLPEDLFNFWQIIHDHPFVAILADRDYQSLKSERERIHGGRPRERYSICKECFRFAARHGGATANSSGKSH